ncbi:MAG: tRNA-dihydrouridine synthase A [Paraglaciecola psychrophila]|jgi:tRNA-dihydrouridine synthase A
MLDRTICIAPMMEWSDRHCRVFWRQLTQHAVLYTEMVTTGAILHAGPERFLRYQDDEHPLALQLGGSNSEDLARCAVIAQQWGYDEVNLNCGCPSDRVQNGMFGACLMAHPQRVADCIGAMQQACDLPITVKHRIGIDDMDSYEQLLAFVEPLRAVGCKTFIVHARNAWLKGLSPKQNREIPPLNYPWVYRLKQDFPELQIIINGGITEIEQCTSHLQHVDGVMLGRAAYHNPYLLAEVDQLFYGKTCEAAQQPAPAAGGNIDNSDNIDDSGNFDDSDTSPRDATISRSRDQVLMDYIPYIELQLQEGVALNHITRHILGLFQGLPGAKIFRRYISQHAHLAGAGIEVVHQAREQMSEAQQRGDDYRALQNASA